MPTKERLHYDWSDPNRVVMTTDSNLWGGRSGHVYTFTRRPDGTTDVDAVVVREEGMMARVDYDVVMRGEQRTWNRELKRFKSGPERKRKMTKLANRKVRVGRRG